MVTNPLTNAAGNTHRFLALDSLRGICACIVIFHHVRSTGYLSNLPPVLGGWMFVDFFFVLSGFVINASYGNRLRNGYPLSRYMFLRWGRIYPLHLAVTMAYLLLEFVAIVLSPGRGAFTGDRSLPALFANLTFTQIFGFSGGSTWNSPAWSIAAEWWAYLITALLFTFAGRFFWPAILAIIAVCGTRLYLAPKHLGHAFDLGLYRGLLGFCVGLVAFALYRRYRQRRPVGSLTTMQATLIELALVAATVLFVSIAQDLRITLAAPFLFSIVVIAFAKEKGLLSQLLLLRSFQLIGVLSYSIYLTHIFLWRRFLEVLQVGGSRLNLPMVEVLADGTERIGTAPIVADIIVLGFAAGVLIASWFSFRLVEQPAREWSRRVAARLGSSARPLPSMAA